MVKAHSDNQEEAFVRINSNEITFWGDITMESMLDLKDAISTAEYCLDNNKIFGIRPLQNPSIILRINSGGGLVNPAMAVVDRLMSSKYNTISIIEGLGGSAATFLSLCCRERLITPSSFVLLHQFTAGMVGTYEEMQDSMVYMDALNDMLTSFYVKHTTAGEKKVKDMLSKDTWLTPKQCLELGIVDEIIGEKQ